MIELILLSVCFCKKFIGLIVVKRSSLIIYALLTNNKLLKVVRGLFNCRMLLDGWAIDFPERKLRFCVTWMCHNLSVRLFLRQFTNSVLGLSSLVDLYRSAGWLEREMFDLFGIFFFGNSDLRRILTDYGFMGFPLRKDFPLSGFFEVRYDDLVKQIILEPLQLSQEFRFYTYDLPWRKIDYV